MKNGSSHKQDKTKTNKKETGQEKRKSLFQVCGLYVISLYYYFLIVSFNWCNNFSSKKE